ncbi:hypothetical protein FJV83_00920 [Mesorhizobium sp. WSM4307]|uniref:hypothetical protein n=1 Tax=unclassified Mesorhizobium TaxID=325217 RepID=UPI00115EB514|nr:MULTISPECIES: hypothetical protein [unclassified Mesorhizobium]TRC72293.1 hypothetical protein FJV81_29475 [Mesorhizobium sp. WSM4315]TRC88272.1 hypothetical protein FJV83_00920 [Mesorhizobium sp. WSM4307]
MTTSNYPIGIDCVWIASDAVGDLGAFTTAGAGPIPLRVLDNDWLPITDIEEAICKLPLISTGKMLIPIKRPDDFVAMAARGFFVYDWQDISRTNARKMGKYEKIASPSKPLNREFLHDELRLIASSIVMLNLKFSEVRAIKIEENFDPTVNAPELG